VESLSLCHNMPVCVDSSCRLEHEFSEPATSDGIVPFDGQSSGRDEAQAGEECGCDIFSCNHNPKIRVTPQELARAERKRRIKAWSPSAIVGDI